MTGARGARRTTLRDVAQAANVSTTTVSDSLTGNGSLPLETRLRVQQVARELGYRPSAAARSLRNGRTGVLAISMRPSDVDAESVWHVDFFMRVMAGAAIEAAHCGYVLAVVPAPMQLGVAYDGLIVVDAPDDDPLLEHARESGTPVSTVGRTASVSASWVDNDYDVIIARAMDHLAAQGARRPMLITHESAVSYVRDVEREFTSWCTAQGVAARSSRIADGFNVTKARAAVQDLLAAPGRPDAVFAALDQLALAAEMAALNLGLRVPEDVMVIGLGDGPTVANAPVPITVLELHAEEMGRATVAMLVEQIERGAQQRCEVVSGQLVERASTARVVGAATQTRMASSTE